MPIKGEFSKSALFLHLLLAAAAGIAFWQMSPLYSSGEISISGPEFYIAVPLYAIFTLFALISPFVNIKNILIDGTTIQYKYLLSRKTFNLKDVDGYFIMELPSRDTTYETMYPVSCNRILPPISSFYISNYNEMKEAVPFKKLGKVKFSWKNYMLVLFFKKYNELDR